MKQLMVALCLLSCAVGAFAKNQPIKCNTNGNQMELNQCAEDTFTAADKALNKTWQALMAKLKHDKAATVQLKSAQKAWIAFRDAEVAAIFACDENDTRVCWGSMYPLLYSGAMTELTNERTQRLQQYVDKGLNPSLGN